MDEFKLERLDTRGPGDLGSLKPETYFINGRHYTQAAGRARVRAARQADPRGLRLDGRGRRLRDRGRRREFDRMSIAQYFDQIGATGWMRELLDVAYVTEYGLDAGEQSALNFIFLIGTGELKDTEEFAAAGRKRRALQGSRRQPAGR